MKVLAKIVCAPIIAVLAVFVWVTKQIIKISAVVLNVIAILTALGALCILLRGDMVQAIAGFVAAFLLTPYGLPMLSIILLGQVQRFRYWIQDSVYG